MSAPRRGDGARDLVRTRTETSFLGKQEQILSPCFWLVKVLSRIGEERD